MDNESAPAEETEELAPKMTAEERQKLEAAERERWRQDEAKRGLARERAAVNAAARLAAAPPHGSFAIRPERVRLEFKPASGSLAGGGAGVARVAVAFALVELESGLPVDPCPAWWQPVPPRAAVVDPSSGMALLGDEHLSATGRFPLSEGALSACLAWGLQCTVHQVRSGLCDPATDPALGSCVVPLQRLLLDELPEVKAEFALGVVAPDDAPHAAGGSEGGDSGSPLAFNGSTSFLRLSLTCDDDLSEFALGGRTLAFSAPVVLTHPPKDWVPVLPPGTALADAHAALADAAAACAVAGGGAFSFALALRGGATSAGVGNTLQPALAFGPGVLAYAPPSPEAQAAAEAVQAAAQAAAQQGDRGAEPARGGAADADAPAAVFVAGVWTLGFAPPPRPAFLSRATCGSLQRLARDGEPLELLAVRTAAATEPNSGGVASNAAADDAEPWAMVRGLCCAVCN
jgi:hypothetical protein